MMKLELTLIDVRETAVFQKDCMNKKQARVRESSWSVVLWSNRKSSAPSISAHVVKSHHDIIWLLFTM